MKQSLIAFGLCLSFGLTAAHGEEKDEELLSFDKVPAAVKATVEKEVGQNTLFELEKLVVKGKTVYEAEFRLLNDPDQEIEIFVGEDGKILGKKVETVITLGKLPPAVLKAALAEIKNGKVGLVEREVVEDRTYYEVEFELAGKEHEVFFAESGEVVTREPEGLDIQLLSR